MHTVGTYNNPWIYETTQFFSFTTNRVSSKNQTLPWNFAEYKNLPL